jgi:hypothetical protein
MPVITCPKCQGKLRFPDDSPPRRVKCPTCGHVFQSTEGIDPASPHAPAPSPEAPRKREEAGRGRDDDYDRRRRRDDDDDYDRDRRSRRRDDDDDDYPRRRRRDEKDDYDDRWRRRRDEDDDDRRRSRRESDAQAFEGQMNRASLACLLYFIGGWLQVGGLGLVFFVIFLHWIGVTEGLTVFTVLAGLLGLGYWLTSGTGIGFLVSGPRARGALGLSIATAATAGLHLLLIIIIATNRYYGGFGFILPGYPGEVHWHAFVTQARALPSLLFAVIGFDAYFQQPTQGALVPVLTNLLEVARGILFLLTLRAIMLCARDFRGASLAMKATIGYAIGAGALLIVGILFGLLFLVVRPSRGEPPAFESLSAVLHMYQIVLYLLLAAMAVGINLVVRTIKGNIDYRR